MPSPVKKPRAGSALARFISTLRPDRKSGSGGSLPVLTGFPTSLADLYVKNQSRLKKPSNKTRRKRHGGGGTNSAAISPVSSSTDIRDLNTSPVLEVRGSDLAEIVEDGRISDVSDGISGKNGSLGVGFVVFVKILVLVLLAIFGKNLVLGVTAFTFFIWFCDCVRPDLVGFFKPCVEARINLSFEIVSPVREIEIQTESESIQSEIGDDLIQSSISDEIRSENSDLCEVPLTLTTSNSKKKNILSKLFRSRSKRKSKEETAEFLGDDSSRGGEIEMVSESSSEKDKDEIANLIIIEENQVEDLRPEISQNCEIKDKKSCLIIFFVVIMFGLVEGKTIAIILTIFSFISMYLVEIARNNTRERVS